MSIYQNFADTPDGIVKEGQEITLSYTRNSDGTATLSWNIPSPANGCTADTQAYNGILITADTKAANYKSTSPQNGTLYSADPTVDPDLFTGDKIDTAFVVGAFYNDKTTTSVTVNNLDPTSFYYFSAYAVDNVGRYYREGVHSYSLPSGPDEYVTPEYNAYQAISILPNEPVNHRVTLNTLTGLDQTKNYKFFIKVDRKPYLLNINGAEAQTYNDLVNTLNKQFKWLTGNSYKAPLPPNANQYYLDIPAQTLYLWDGFNNNPEKVLFLTFDPSTHPQGYYWFNPNTPNEIQMYETGGWAQQPFISLPNDPTQPFCGQLWFTGTKVYEFDGDHWCQLCLYNQTTNPILPPVLDCNTYWYNTTDSLLMKWNVDEGEFQEVLAIISAKDPNTLTTGDFWYNETDNQIYRYVGGQWLVVTNVRYQAPDGDNTIPYPIANNYWYDTTNQIFYKRDSTNTYWIEIPYTMYPTDPLERSSCDLWWNQSPSVDQLYVWDIINLQWKVVTNFLQQANDPSLPPNLPPCVVWYNPQTGVLNYILRNSCISKAYINFLYNPLDPPVGTVWYNSTTSLYYVWNGAAWEQIYPIISTYDPFQMFNGYFWYDPNTNVLNEWNGTGWTQVSFLTSPLTPTIGELWFDTAQNELYEWNGTTWVVSQPMVIVLFRHYPDLYYNDIRDKMERAHLVFVVTEAGCPHIVELRRDHNEWYDEIGLEYFVDVPPEPYGLLTEIAQTVIYHPPQVGNNGVDAGPMYKQMDVGTDGTPDERRTLQATLRTLLGSIGVQVELSKDQINTAIDNALLMFRRYSSYAYTRNFFFLDAKPNQQTYHLTNRCVGFNKIVDIRTLYRMQAGWIRTGLAGNELFGVAALQQLYTVGTFDMLSFGLMSMYMKELEQVFASRIMHQWVEKTRELRLFQRIVLPERILVDAVIERTEQDLMTNRASALWIQSYALAECKRILSQVRGKYLNLPGPNGSTTLNAQDLASQAETEKQALMEEIFDPAMGNNEDVGLSGHFVIG
jgi:hypothetical protein